MAEPAATTKTTAKTVATATTGIYCKACGYDLRASGEAGRCPECGRAFAPGNPKTFRTRPLVPWTRALARWARRLAILLLALALLLAGGWGWLYWGWRQEQAALAQLAPADYHLTAMGGEWGRGPSDKDFPGAFVLRRVTWINMRRAATDADLRPLRKLQRLEALNLNGTKLTDAGFAHLAALPKLESLSLDRTQVTDAGLVHLAKFPALKGLSLRDTRITDAGVVHLEKLRTLQYLELWGTKVTPAGMTRLQAALPHWRGVPDAGGGATGGPAEGEGEAAGYTRRRDD